MTKAIASEKAKANKVWDYCHITGKFCGSAHSDCNLKLKIEPWKTPIPVIFHNFWVGIGIDSNFENRF